ncbi:MAG: class I SAM-dependent methyltransferase [Pseudomonadota bacterium]
MTRLSAFIAGRTPAELYEQYLVPGLFTPWAHDLVEGAPRSGRILDLACGTGVVSRALARRSGTACSIVAVDIAPPMLKAARQRALSDGVAAQIAFHRAEADALPFDDDAFGAAFCQQGIQFFPDRVAALSEVRRVLRSGGVFAASVWRAASDGNPVFEAVENVIADRLGDDLAPLGPFSFGDAAALKGAFAEAGFRRIEIEPRSKVVRLPDVETFVLFDILFLGRPDENGAMQPVIAPDDPAGDAVIAHLIEDLTFGLAEFVTADGAIEAPMAAHLVRAVA